MKCMSLVFLAVFGLAVQALAKDVTQQQLKALEKQLEHAPFVVEKVQFDDGVDSIHKIWNPIAWAKNKFRNKCKCEGDECDCCFKLKVLDNTACLKSKKLPSNQEIAISFVIDDKTLVSKSFSVKRSDSVCGVIPPPFAYINYCFNQKSSMAGDGTVKSCSDVELKVGGAIGAILQFKCIEIKNGKISIGGYQEVQKDAMLVVKAKNPFKNAVQWFKKNKSAKVL